MNSADFWSITLGVLFTGSIVFLAFVGVLRWMLRIDKIVELLEEIAQTVDAQRKHRAK